MYGGAKGGAKTESLVISPLRQVHNPNFRALLLREEWSELREIQDRCRTYYAALGAVWRAKDDHWLFPSGAFVEVGYCKDLGDVTRYQGREWSSIDYDEIGNLADEAVWDTLLAEIRSPDKSLVLMARCSANPGGKGHGWLKRRFIVPTDRGRTVWRNPATGLARRFIPSRVTDNPVYANDAQYMAILNGLPDLQRRQLRDGDWDAGEGMALEELNREVHFCDPFEIPDHWFCWGGFDWGYRHPYAFGYAAQNPEGDAYLIDSVHGMKQYPNEIAARINESLLTTWPTRGVKRLQFIHAGRDCFDEVRARGENTPTIHEQFMESGIYMDKANVSRVFGLTNLQYYLTWRGQPKPNPRLHFFRTPGNLLTFDCLESIVTDPKKREDALKVDAVDGKGGDDAYDMTRYLMAAHPITPERPRASTTVGPNQDDFWQHIEPLVNEDAEPLIVGGLGAGF